MVALLPEPHSIWRPQANASPRKEMRARAGADERLAAKVIVGSAVDWVSATAPTRSRLGRGPRRKRGARVACRIAAMPGQTLGVGGCVGESQHSRRGLVKLLFRNRDIDVMRP
jgi:hypothetical protein